MKIAKVASRSGIVFAIFSSVLFGASTPLAKLLLGTVDPWLLAGLLYLGSGIGLGVVYLIRGHFGLASVEAPLRSSDLPWVFSAVFAGGLVAPVLLMFGLSQTSASSAALLLNVEGLATIAIAWLVFRESVDFRILTGAFAILAGAILLSWQPGATVGISLPAVAIFGACVSWGIDNNLTRKLSAADPVQIAMLKGLVAGAVNLVIALFRGSRFPSGSTMMRGGFVGFFGYGVSLTLFVLALRYLGTARTSAYFSTAPFVGAILSLILFRDELTSKFVVAGLLMGVGIFLNVSERHEHEHVHEGLEHEHRHVHDEHHQHAHAPGDPTGEPHTHRHRHSKLVHKHPHYPDLHHTHTHSSEE